MSWGFTDRPCITLGNAVFRGLIGGTGAKAIIVQALEAGTFVPSPHGTGQDFAQATRITPGEAGLLQGFPLDWPWRGPKGEQGHQIGNAIPVGLALAVLAQVAS